MTAENEHFYETFQPSHYDLYIDVNRGTKVISGRTTISANTPSRKCWVLAPSASPTWPTHVCR